MYRERRELRLGGIGSSDWGGVGSSDCGVVGGSDWGVYGIQIVEV